MEDNLKASLVVKEHNCEMTERQSVIGVEKYRLPGDSIERWFLRVEDQLNEIRYCPYCGVALERDGHGL